jgi:hypothetical protein
MSAPADRHTPENMCKNKSQRDAYGRFVRWTAVSTPVPAKSTAPEAHVTRSDARRTDVLAAPAAPAAPIALATLAHSKCMPLSKTNRPLRPNKLRRHWAGDRSLL